MEKCTDRPRDDLCLIRLSDVPVTRVRWLWPGRFALGKLSLIIGDPSTNKSTLLMDIMARVTSGRGWPDGRDVLNEPGNCMLLTAEDGLGDTVHPRIIAAEGDASKVFVIKHTNVVPEKVGEPDARSFDLSKDIHLLERAIGDVGGVRLLCIDPLSSYLGEWTDSHRDASVRRVLEPLQDLAERLDVPLVVEVNAILTEEAKTFRSLQLAEIATTIEQRVLERADMIIAVSRQLSDRIAARGIDRGKIRIVPNGINTELFDQIPSSSECREQIGVDASFVVGFVGSLKSWHGVDLLLSAFARLLHDEPDARLLIVGKGPMEKALRADAVALKAEHAVVFTGAVSHQRVPLFLGAMDVAVAPFHPMDDFYFSPIKLFEYMAASRCTIASDLGQMAEVIDDGVNGLLFPAGDEDALYDAMTRARVTPDLRERLGAEGRRLVYSRFTWTEAARVTTAVLDTAIRRRAATCPSSIDRAAAATITAEGSVANGGRP